MLQQRVTERSEHAVVVTVQFRLPRQIDGLCNTTRPPRCLGKNHPGITPFGYCLVPLWSATLLRDISVRDISVILRLAVSKELELNTAPVPVDLTLFKAYDVRGIAGENLTLDQMSEKLSKGLGIVVKYHAVEADAYRGFGFPGADEMGNMFQVYRDFEREVLGARSADAARSLNPDLQTFDQWIAKNKSRIPL